MSGREGIYIKKTDTRQNERNSESLINSIAHTVVRADDRSKTAATNLFVTCNVLGIYSKKRPTLDKAKEIANR